MDSPRGPSRQGVDEMFDRVAGRYDLLNHLLSCGQDLYWRRSLSKRLAYCGPTLLLDIGTGTGAQVISAMGHCPDVRSTGLDMSRQMLDLAQRKLLRRQLTDRISLVRGDALHLPFAADRFSAVTISFGIRNFSELSQGLREMHRVLSPDGRLFILEFSLPALRLIRIPYLLYFRHVLPVLGSLISGDRLAYRYLNRTVETFPYGDEFCDLLLQLGFENVKCTPLTLGVASLYEARK